MDEDESSGSVLEETGREVDIAAKMCERDRSSWSSERESETETGSGCSS